MNRSHGVPFLPRVHENRSHMVKIFFLIKFFVAQHTPLLPASSRTTHGSSSTMLEQAATITKQPAREPNSPATTDSRNHHACNSPKPAHPLRRATRTISLSQRRRSGSAIGAHKAHILKLNFATNLLQNLPTHVVWIDLRNPFYHFHYAFSCCARLWEVLHVWQPHTCYLLPRAPLMATTTPCSSKPPPSRSNLHADQTLQPPQIRAATMPARGPNSREPTCFRVAVVAGVVARVHHQSEWVRHRWVVMFSLFIREVKGRGDLGD